MDDTGEQTFLAMLFMDVDAAISRHQQSGNQATKRDLIRTTFAAIEGSVWIFREHVLDSARTTAKIKPDEELALSEVSYQINEQGRISTQPKYLALLPTIRLIARISTRIVPELQIDFSGKQWENLRRVIKLRNRITHPKSKHDLLLSDDDIRLTLEALFWLLEEIEGVMTASNLAIKDYLGQFREILEALKTGDKEILALYEAATKAVND